MALPFFRRPSPISNTSTDEALIQAVQSGNARAAYAELVKRYAEALRIMAYRQLNHAQEAEDVVQEVFTKLWQRPHLFDATRGSRFKTWLFRVLLNACKDRYRANVPTPTEDEMLSLESVSDAASALETLMADERRNTLAAAVHRLPEQQRNAILLCYYQGMTNQEAAATLGVSVKALESLLMRGKATLKNKFAAHRQNAQPEKEAIR